MKRFLLGLTVVSLLIAGAVSYLADSAPDGLDTATMAGCTVVRPEGDEQLRGDCMAQSANEHALSGAPLADYTVFGDDLWTGVAGILGVAVTAVLAGGLFWGLRKRRHDHRSTGDDSTAT